MTILDMHNSMTYKKKVNTCKNESSGDKRENEHAENQFKKALDLRQC
jgi:hypothetical protein